MFVGIKQTCGSRLVKLGSFTGFVFVANFSACEGLASLYLRLSSPLV